MKELTIEEMTILKGGFFDANVAVVAATNNNAYAQNNNTANGGGFFSPAIAVAKQDADANAGNIRNTSIRQFA
jgi:hypothetical protein